MDHRLFVIVRWWREQCVFRLFSVSAFVLCVCVCNMFLQTDKEQWTLKCNSRQIKRNTHFFFSNPKLKQKRRSCPRISLHFHAQLCFLYVNCQAILYSGSLRYPSSNSYTSSVLFKLPECIISLKTESIFDSRKYNSLMIFMLKYQLSFLGTKEPVILHTDFLTENYSNLISENLFFVFVPTIFEYCENKV